MYFAYLGHYTKSLTFPAFVGFIFWIMSSKNQVILFPATSKMSNKQKKKKSQKEREEGVLFDWKADLASEYLDLQVSPKIGWGYHTAQLSHSGLIVMHCCVVYLCAELFSFVFVQYVEDIIFVAFALINIVWSTLYLESWKRRSAEFAYKWGTLDKEDELLVEPRPLFTVS